VSAHTPGPWRRAGKLGHAEWITTDSGEAQIATVYGPSITPSSAANADLIAAAPEILQALRVLLDQVDYTSGACTMTEMVGAVLPREVLAKARAAIKRAAP
jgi:hypothetical protein